MPLVDRPDETRKRNEELNQSFARLYDPPVNGKTPLDPTGYPYTSLIVLRDVDAKVAQGFTREAIGIGDDWPELGSAIEPNAYPFSRRDHIQAEREQEGDKYPGAIVTGKATRKRTVKR